jgi:hypothetical protein
VSTNVLAYATVPTAFMIEKSDDGVRVFIPSTAKARWKTLLQGVGLLSVILFVGVWGVIDIASVLSRGGASFWFVLCGIGILLAMLLITLAVASFFTRRTMVIEVDATELRVSAAGSKRPPRRWPRAKVRRVVIHPQILGQSLLCLQIGYDVAFPISGPTENAQADAAAAALHDALGISDAPGTGSIIPGVE